VAERDILEFRKRKALGPLNFGSYTWYRLVITTDEKLYKTSKLM